MCRGTAERRLQPLHTVSVKQVRSVPGTGSTPRSGESKCLQSSCNSLTPLSFFVLARGNLRVRMLDDTERRALPH